MQGPQRAIGVGWQVAVRSRCVRGSSDERVESVSFAHHQSEIDPAGYLEE